MTDFAMKREFRREELKDGVRMRTKAGVEYASFSDLSASGMRLQAEHSFEVGELLELDFSFRARGVSVRMETMARVVRCVQEGSNLNSFIVGVEFVDSKSLKKAVRLKSLVDAEEGPF